VAAAVVLTLVHGTFADTRGWVAAESASGRAFPVSAWKVPRETANLQGAMR
jgi:hypothetical protein